MPTRKVYPPVFVLKIFSEHKLNNDLTHAQDALSEKVLLKSFYTVNGFLLAIIFSLNNNWNVP